MSKIKKAIFFLCIGLTLSISVLATDNEKAEKLIRQFKGEACYWDYFGKQVGFSDRWTIRHYEKNCKITAAKLLGEMGPEAKKAVPALIEALQNGPNDIDTGDGVLPYRSTIAIALGKIGDPLAIPALIEKLKTSEQVTLSSGASFPVGWKFPTGIGHKAEIEALGMFGPKAKDAIPYLEALQEKSQDEFLKEIIKNALEKIRNE